MPQENFSHFKTSNILIKVLLSQQHLVNGQLSAAEGNQFCKLILNGNAACGGVSIRVQALRRLDSFGS